MSDRVHRLPLLALATGSRGFSRDLRFDDGRSAPVEDAAPESVEPAPDPVADAFARGYAEGAAAARATALAEAAARDSARERIESALGLMDKDALDRFRSRLHDTVMALCGDVLGTAAIDPAALAQRIEKVAAMFQRSTDERIIRLHPEDLTLVHARLPEDWHCEPDPALERGSIRVETATGGVEDGPVQWRAALEEALKGC